MTIRAAVSADEPRLREIAAAAKGHWGYDADRVREWAAALDFAGAELYVAEAEGRAVGWLSLVGRADVCELDHLWIEPDRIGTGIGTALVRFAVARALELGASRLELESEPNAVGFYEKLGAVQVGERVGGWGRPLPLMTLDLGG